LFESARIPSLPAEEAAVVPSDISERVGTGKSFRS
jgi:hypothetical protein